MKQFRNILIIILVFIGSLLQVNGCTEKESETIVIPAILPLTGPSADLGQSVSNGMKLAIEDINTQYPKYKIELKIDDSKGQAKEAVNLFHGLLAQSHSPVVLSWMSFAAKAISPLAKSNDTVLFMGAAMPELTDGRDFVIRVWPNALELANEMTSFAIRKFNNAAILYINDDYGKAVKDAFETKFVTEGKNVVYVDALDFGVTDFRSILYKAKQKEPDVLFIPAYGSTYAHIIKQIKEIMPNVPIIADLTLCNSFTLEQIGVLGNGIYVPATYVDDENTTNLDTSEFQKKYAHNFGKRADFNAGLGYDMAKVATIAILNTNATAMDISNYIKNMSQYSGATGSISYDQNGDCKIHIEMMQIQNGKPTRIH